MKRSYIKRKRNTLKVKASKACSEYVRLRDAIKFCEDKGIDLAQFSKIDDLPVKCCTCSTIRRWRSMDAGHCFGRGLGGGSGAYFDERNIHAQCKLCNGFRGGEVTKHKAYVVHLYGQHVLDELEMMHNQTVRWSKSVIKLTAIKIMYEFMYEELVKRIK